MATHQSWRAAHQSVLQKADAAHQLSQTQREKASGMLEAHSSELQRTQRDVQTKLADRVSDIEQRKLDLSAAMERNEAETAQLNNTRAELEADIAGTELPLGNALECLRARGQRRGPDLFRDRVDAALDTEVALLRRTQDQLRAKLGAVIEQLRLLRAAHVQLREDLRDKAISHEIDSTCVNLDARQATGLFRDSVRTSTSGRAAKVDDWICFTAENVERSKIEVAKSAALRADIETLFQSSGEALRNASNGVEEALRARIAEYYAASEAAGVKLAKIESEIAAQDASRDSLRDTVAAKEMPLRLATTRLEHRQARPNIELVRDAAQVALVSEVGVIDRSVMQLQTQLAGADETLRALLRAALALREDLDCKALSADIDTACLQSRLGLKDAA